MPLDTITVVVGPGVRGQVGTQDIRTRALGDDDVRTFTVVSPRGRQLAYSVAADTGYENLFVLLNDDSVAATGTITVAGNQSFAVAADRTIGADSPNRKLYELLKSQLTAKNPLSVFVDIECETERLLKIFSDSGEKLIDAAEQRAIDPARDAKALRRIDRALAGHAFSGCAEDRRTYRTRKP